MHLQQVSVYLRYDLLAWTLQHELDVTCWTVGLPVTRTNIYPRQELVELANSSPTIVHRASELELDLAVAP